MSVSPNAWFTRFIGTGIWPFARRAGGRSGSYFDDLFRGFDEMRSEFEDQFKNIENRAPKDLIREYESPGGGKIREVGPLVYGYSMTVGPDGKPKIREFGNVKSPLSRGSFSQTTPVILSEREPLADVATTDKEIKVVVEMPGVSKENIKVNAYDSSVEISTTEGAQRKYHEIIELPPEADIETAKSSYNNGILEITFQKKQQSKPKGKEIKID
ncbi:MAG: archaeal heat shock protein Hsp20 [Nitrososphaeraceae archaeon]